jgi:magnesium-transporting ATPase (P-type)
MFEIFYLFSARFLLRNSISIQGILGNPYVLLAIAVLLILQLVFTYSPPMQVLFATTPIRLDAWYRVVLVGFTVLLLVEAEKFLLRRLRSVEKTTA